MTPQRLPDWTKPLKSFATHLESPITMIQPYAATPLVDQIAAEVRTRFMGEGSGHDWYHIERVWRLARHIAAQESAHPEIVSLGALLHDIADWKFHAGDDSAGPRAADALLRQASAPESTRAAVVDIVATLSFKGAGVATPMRTLEGQVVQDADRLDALGAIGIARCFAYGGHAGRPLYDPEQPPVLHATAEAYKTARGTSLNHFHEKLYLLKDRMNTPTGRALAQARHEFLKQFEARFLDEWSGAEFAPTPSSKT